MTLSEPARTRHARLRGDCGGGEDDAPGAGALPAPESNLEKADTQEEAPRARSRLRTRRQPETAMPVWTSAVFAGDIALFLASDGAALVRASFATSPEAPPALWPREWAREPADRVLAAAVRQLNEYFARERQAFSIPLRPAGTPFQLRVWKALEEIPYGHTRTYRDIARALGQPAAVRAVGAANGRNPLPIFVPCHRGIGTSGSLSGYGGGLRVKLELLRLEGVLLPG